MNNKTETIVIALVFCILGVSFILGECVPREICLRIALTAGGIFFVATGVVLIVGTIIVVRRK